MNSTEDPKDSEDQRDVLLTQSSQCGENSSAFVPDEQPFPSIWDPDLSEDRKQQLEAPLLRAALEMCRKTLQ
jgi:hypothetical protein